MKPCVLIVDDDAHVVRQLKWAFHDQFEVIHALTQDQIDQTLRKHRPTVVLVDMHLPPTLQSTETGLGLVRKLRDSHPDLRIIGISVDTDPSIPNAVLGAGGSFFLQKPFTDESFKTMLRQL